MDRTVTCNVTNNTDYDLTLLSYSPGPGQGGGAFSDDHGSWHLTPVSTLDHAKTTEAFKIEKTDGGTVGSTGWVSYDLKNGQGRLILMFSNPVTQDGSGSNENCWFYAVIQGYDNDNTGNQEVGVDLLVKATVSGFTFNNCNPTKTDDMSVTVTVSNI